MVNSAVLIWVETSASSQGIPLSLQVIFYGLPNIGSPVSIMLPVVGKQYEVDSTRPILLPSALKLLHAQSKVSVTAGGSLDKRGVF